MSRMIGSSWSASIGSISRNVRPMCCSIDAPFSCASQSLIAV
jgi:hypothetical protein